MMSRPLRKGVNDFVTAVLKGVTMGGGSKCHLKMIPSCCFLIWEHVPRAGFLKGQDTIIQDLRQMFQHTLLVEIRILIARLMATLLWQTYLYENILFTSK